MLYTFGASGPEISQIETALSAMGLYKGPIDGIFGGGLQAAVRNFQAQKGLSVDGTVGDQTWGALFGGQAAPPPAIAAFPVGQRCLALTGSFETSLPQPDCFAGIAGNFDGAGLSFGALQWNLGQGTLQPMLRDFIAQNLAIAQQIFDSNLAILTTMLTESIADQVAWGTSISCGPNRADVVEPWKGQFKTLGRSSEFQTLELACAAGLLENARGDMGRFGVISQRALALLFDIATQNGGISALVGALIQQDFAALDPALSPDDLEVAKLCIIANRRADAANPQWQQDVRSRKLAIAQGSGTVHGRLYDLATQFAIGLVPA